MKKWFVFALLLGVCLSGLFSQSVDAIAEEAPHICMDQVKEWYVTLPFEAFSEKVHNAYDSVHLWPLEEQTEYYQMMGSDAHQLPDEHEIPQSEAVHLAYEYLINHHFASEAELSLFRQGITYFGGASVGWVVVWLNEGNRVVWQVSLEKNTGCVIEVAGTEES